MSLKLDLNRSLAVAPAEAALRRAVTLPELQDAWYDHGCQDYAEGSDPHVYLLGIYNQRAKAIREAMLAPYLLRT